MLNVLILDSSEIRLTHTFRVWNPMKTHINCCFTEFLKHRSISHQNTCARSTARPTLGFTTGVISHRHRIFKEENSKIPIRDRSFHDHLYSTCFFSGQGGRVIEIGPLDTTGQSRNELPVWCFRNPGNFCFHLGCRKPDIKKRERLWEGKWLLDVAGLSFQLQVYIFSHPNCASQAKDPLDTVLALALFTSPCAWMGEFPIRTGSFCMNDHLLKPHFPELFGCLGRRFPFQNYLSSNRSTG